MSPVSPDVGIKIAQMFSKVAQKAATAVLLESEVLQNGSKSDQIIWLLLHENLLQRTFKNRPIWSHCQRRPSLSLSLSLSLSMSMSLSLWNICIGFIEASSE